MRPVDADAIYNEALENHQKGEIEDWEFDLIINYLDGAPTLNVETNMRCKDCKHWQRHTGVVDSPNGRHAQTGDMHKRDGLLQLRRVLDNTGGNDNVSD